MSSHPVARTATDGYSFVTRRLSPGVIRGKDRGCALPPLMASAWVCTFRPPSPSDKGTSMPRLPRLAITAALVLSTSVAVDGGAAASAATAPPGFGYGTPGFVDSAAPSSFSGAQFAGEPSVGVNWKSGAAMYMA